MLALRLANPTWDALDYLQHVGTLTEEDVFVARQLVPREDGLEAFKATQPLHELSDVFKLVEDPDSALHVPFDVQPFPPPLIGRTRLMPFGTPLAVAVPGPIEPRFSHSKPWDWDDEAKVVPVLRPPFTDSDYEQLMARKDIRYLRVLSSKNRTTALEIRWFFQALTVLLQQPVLLAPGQWHTVTEINHGLAFQKSMRSLIHHLYRHGTLEEVFVMFRALAFLLRRSDLLEDTCAALPILKTFKTMTPPLSVERRFQVFLAYFAATWNLWSWDETRAWHLYHLVVQQWYYVRPTPYSSVGSPSTAPLSADWNTTLLCVQATRKKKGDQPDAELSPSSKRPRLLEVSLPAGEGGKGPQKGRGKNDVHLVLSSCLPTKSAAVEIVSRLHEWGATSLQKHRRWFGGL